MKFREWFGKRPEAEEGQPLTEAAAAAPTASASSAPPAAAGSYQPPQPPPTPPAVPAPRPEGLPRDLRPGYYIVVSDQESGVPVSNEVRRSTHIAYLKLCDTCKVLEIHPDFVEGQIRGRIEQPAGWASLGTQMGEVFLQRQGSRPPSPSPDAKRAEFGDIINEEMEQLLEAVKVYEDIGNYTAAREHQELLVSRLMEKQAAETDGRMQSLLSRELGRMDHFNGLAGHGGSASSSSGARPVNDGKPAQQAGAAVVEPSSCPASAGPEESGMSSASGHPAAATDGMMNLEGLFHDFRPGYYIVVYDADSGVPVSSEVDRKSAQVATLKLCDTCKVLEIHPDLVQGRIRGRIEQPAGWASLVTQMGEVFLQRQGSRPPSPSPDAKRAEFRDIISVEMEQLLEAVEVYEANGNYKAAREHQELLVSRLMEDQASESEGPMQSLLSRELGRMDHFNGLAGHGGSASSSSGARPLSDVMPAQQAGVAVVEPRSCTASGGAHVRWVGPEPIPVKMYIGRDDDRPCAPLEDGVFFVPRGKIEPGESLEIVDLRVVSADGAQTIYPKAFSYWLPGRILGVEPALGPATGGIGVTVTTSDLGAPISVALIGGVQCEPLEQATSCTAVVVLPAADSAEGAVDLKVIASNGNIATQQGGFSYFQPEVFGKTGEKIELSDGNSSATRIDGVNHGVCFGASAVRQVPEGRYFEIEVQEVTRNIIRAMALGIAAARPDSELVAAHNGKILAPEARELQRVWLVGYDKAGAIFCSDGEESKIPTSSWRAATDVKAGTRLGVLWAAQEDGAASLVLFQDGVERLRRPASGRLPSREEAIYAVVDIQGSAKKVAMVTGAVPPPPPGSSTRAELQPEGSQHQADPQA